MAVGQSSSLKRGAPAASAEALPGWDLLTPVLGIAPCCGECHAALVICGISKSQAALGSDTRVAVAVGSGVSYSGLPTLDLLRSKQAVIPSHPSELF